ncbi:bifunctional GNAT family N-acetyltransferase/acetate--CoA ligase family protein [Glycomyces scopariae]
MNLRPIPAADVLDADGRIVRLRPRTPGDADALFPVGAPPHGHGSALAAVAEADGEPLAAAVLEVEGAEPKRARLHVSVAPAHAKRGLRTLLAEHLRAAAAAAGIKDVAADPAPAAEQSALRPLLDPAAVAVVGTERPGPAAAVLRSLLDHGFTGTLVPRLPAGGEPVDLVIAAVPAPAAADVLERAGRAGARAAVILSTGTGRTAGTIAQEGLLHVARAHGIRLVGPDSLGVVSTPNRLQAGLAAEPPRPGGLCLVAQSDAVAAAALAHAARAGLGLHAFVALGDKTDVSANDLLAHWYDDPGAAAVALYPESFGNPRRFARLARAVARRKPVLAVKGGGVEPGRRTGLARTAGAAASDTAVDDLFAQAGVIRCDTFAQLADTARVLIGRPLPQGRRLGVVGDAAGAGTLAADAAAAAGLGLPAFGAATLGHLAEIAPGAAAADNPVDLGPAADPDAFAEALAVLGTSGEVDAVLAVITATGDDRDRLAAVGDALDGLPHLPAAVVAMGLPDAPLTLGARRIPVFDFPEPAVAALGRAAEYAAWRARPLGARPALPGIDRDRARAIVDRLLRAGGGWQTAADAAAILACYDIQLIEALHVISKGEAVAAARAVGYPVAVKAEEPDLVPKGGESGVHLGLSDAHEVRSAFADVAARIDGDDHAAVVVQPMLDAGIELAAGIVHDPLFGSLVVLGLGGAPEDRQHRILPLTGDDAESMWRSLRSGERLTEYSGSRPVDLDALTDLLVRLGRLAEDLPEIAELDLNPVMPLRYGVQAVDVKLRLSRTAA